MFRTGQNIFKKSGQKNTWNCNFHFWYIVLPVQNLIFGHFWNCKIWNLVKKIIREIDFTSFFTRTFLTHHCCDFWRKGYSSPIRQALAHKIMGPPYDKFDWISSLQTIWDCERNEIDFYLNFFSAPEPEGLKAQKKFRKNQFHIIGKINPRCLLAFSLL